MDLNLLKQNPFFRAIKTLGDVFVPIIPAIVASDESRRDTASALVPLDGCTAARKETVTGPAVASSSRAMARVRAQPSLDALPNRMAWGPMQTLFPCQPGSSPAVEKSPSEVAPPVR